MVNGIVIHEGGGEGGGGVEVDGEGDGAAEGKNRAAPVPSSPVHSASNANANASSEAKGASAADAEAGRPRRDSGEKLCKICYEEPFNCLVLPCAHLAMCENCAKDVFAKKMGCIICREPIGRLQTVFM